MIAFAIVSVQAIAPRVAWACTCAPASDAEHYEGADAVFIGEMTNKDDPHPTATPTEPERQGDTITYTFDVEEAQKGDVDDPEQVDSIRASNFCGYQFAEGERYQVFADLRDGRYETSICSGTRSLGDQEPYRPATPTPDPPTPEPTQPPPTQPPPTEEPEETEATETEAPPTIEPSPTAFAIEEAGGTDPILWIGIGLAVVAAAAGGGFLFVRRRPTS